MLILHPAVVKFGSTILENIAAVTLDRSPQKDVVEWSDNGPYAVMADVPEQKVTATLRQRLNREDINAPEPGSSGTLSVSTAPTAGDTGRRRLTASAVVLSCTHDIDGAWGRQQPTATRVIKLILLSPDGSTDPVTITDAGPDA